jgi:hypothetical protein
MGIEMFDIVAGKNGVHGPIHPRHIRHGAGDIRVYRGVNVQTYLLPLGGVLNPWVVWSFRLGPQPMCKKVFMGGLARFKCEGHG